MWLIYTIALFVILYFVLYTSKTVKHQLALKFKTLITCLLQLDKNLKIEYESNESIVLFTSNARGSISVFLIENYGLLFVTIESINTQNYIEKKEWLFIDKMNQYLIFDEIVTGFFKEYKSQVFSPKKVKQIIHSSAEKTKNIKIEPIFSKNNLSQSSFCIAFNTVKILAQNKNINNQSSFEILLFNCVVCFQKINKTKNNLQWQEYINLLTQYLENQRLTKQIENLASYFDHRISLYTEQLELIQSNTNPNYNLLYYYFFEKPLSTKTKIKHREWDHIHFVKTMLIMIAEIEDKTVQLERLSL